MNDKKRIIILTGDETRHKYFRTNLGHCKDIEILASFCEGDEKSLLNRIISDPESSKLQRLHVDARIQSEEDFFGVSLQGFKDYSNPIYIKKGSINDACHVDHIKSLDPDLIICYGSSIIKSDLLSIFAKKFLNVHLGLSPYYRGSGTNIWPLINGEPHMVGATFMYIDEGIDTGQIIHQIRAKIFLGDSPHTIGNRLIMDMTKTYCEIIKKYDQLTIEKQPSERGKLYFEKDFNSEACESLYKKFNDDMIYYYLKHHSSIKMPYFVSNEGLKKS